MRIVMTLVISFVIASQTYSVLHSQDVTKWTSPEGKVVQGEFVRLDGKKVVLKLDTGKEVQVPLSSLSLESHLQALKLAKPEEFNKELIKAPVIVEAVTPASVAPITSIMDFPYGEDPTIDQFLKTSVDEWKRGNYFIVWHMLPPKMQQDVVKVIADTMRSLGAQGTGLFQRTFGVLGSLASKKKDWIVNTDLEKLFPVAGTPEQKEKNWAIMVGLMQKLGDEDLWNERNFQQDMIVDWIARMSELLAYARELEPSLNEITYNIVSQSADRAEVEATFGSQPKQTFNFQKVGDIWVVPEYMNTLRENVNQELESAPTLERMKTAMAGLALFGPALKKMDEAKTREEFNQALAQSGLGRMLSSIPSAQSPGAGGVAGLPFGLPGLGGGFPGLPGATSGSQSGGTR